jgi:hypothetical protein
MKEGGVGAIYCGSSQFACGSFQNATDHLVGAAVKEVSLGGSVNVVSVSDLSCFNVKGLGAGLGTLVYEENVVGSGASLIVTAATSSLERISFSLPVSFVPVRDVFIDSHPSPPSSSLSLSICSFTFPTFSSDPITYILILASKGMLRLSAVNISFIIGKSDFWTTLKGRNNEIPYYSFTNSNF